MQACGSGQACSVKWDLRESITPISLEDFSLAESEASATSRNPTKGTLP